MLERVYGMKVMISFVAQEPYFHVYCIISIDSYILKLLYVWLLWFLE